MKRILMCFWASTLVALPARANPVMAMADLTLMQVPGTQDVLVTMKYISFVTLPSTVTRDAEKIPMSWTPTNAKLTYDNTGSGTWNATSAQWCDCNVPLGTHIYGVYPEIPIQRGLTSAGIDVVKSQSEPLDASAGLPDAAPWDATAPAVTGLNCKAICAAATADAGAAGGATSTGGQGPSGGTSSPLSASNGGSQPVASGGSDTGGAPQIGGSPATGGGTYTSTSSAQGGAVLQGTAGSSSLTGGKNSTADGGAAIGGAPQGGDANTGGVSSTTYVKETGNCSFSVPRRRAAGPMLVLAFGLLCGALRRKR